MALKSAQATPTCERGAGTRRSVRTRSRRSRECSGRWWRWCLDFALGGGPTPRPPAAISTKKTPPSTTRAAGCMQSNGSGRQRWAAASRIRNVSWQLRPSKAGRCRSLPVLPLSLPWSKHPRFKRLLHHATCDPDSIEKHRYHHPYRQHRSAPAAGMAVLINDPAQRREAGDSAVVHGTRADARDMVRVKRVRVVDTLWFVV